MASTEVLLVGGERLLVEGGAEEVEVRVIEAARGSIMKLVWLTEADGGRRVAVNPAHVVAVRTVQA